MADFRETPDFRETADSRETRQQELARLLLQKARQDLDLVVSVVDSEAVADELAHFSITSTAV